MRAKCIKKTQMTAWIITIYCEGLRTKLVSTTQQQLAVRWKPYNTLVVSYVGYRKAQYSELHNKEWHYIKTGDSQTHLIIIVFVSAEHTQQRNLNYGSWSWRSRWSWGSLILWVSTWTKKTEKNVVNNHHQVGLGWSQCWTLTHEKKICRKWHQCEIQTGSVCRGAIFPQFHPPLSLSLCLTECEPCSFSRPDDGSVITAGHGDANSVNRGIIKFSRGHLCNHDEEVQY